MRAPMALCAVCHQTIWLRDRRWVHRRTPTGKKRDRDHIARVYEQPLFTLDGFGRQ